MSSCTTSLIVDSDTRKLLTMACIKFPSFFLINDTPGFLVKLNFSDNDFPSRMGVLFGYRRQILARDKKHFSGLKHKEPHDT